MGQEGQPSCALVVSTVQALSHLPALGGGRATSSPLGRRELQLCHPVLRRDVGGSAGSGPTDPSGLSCVPTAAPQAQEQKLKELRTLPGSGTATVRRPRGRTLCRGAGLLRGWEPSVLPASNRMAKASTRSPAQVLRHDGQRGWPRGGLGRAARLDPRRLPGSLEPGPSPETLMHMGAMDGGPRACSWALPWQLPTSPVDTTAGRVPAPWFLQLRNGASVGLRLDGAARAAPGLSAWGNPALQPCHCPKPHGG